MRNFLFLILIVLIFGSCDPAAPKNQHSIPSYFDLKGFIDKEVKRLEQINPEIEKTVLVNQTEEHKILKIHNWQKELAAFSDADINKSAWAGLFKIHKTKNAETYTSDQDNIPVKSLSIFYKNNRIFKVQVLNSNTNSLYTSNDTLSYFPDSLYQISKKQHIRLLSEKNYRITGRLRN